MKADGLPVTLAELGARSASAGSPDLLISVEHAGLAGQDETLDLEAPVSTPAVEADEELQFRVGGIEVRIGSRVKTHADTPGNGDFLLMPMAWHSGESGIIRRHFRAQLGQNPTFLYDARRSVEILMTLKPEQDEVTYGDSLMLVDAIEAMAHAAAAVAEAPILFLQTPVASHNAPSGRFRTDGSGERPRRANSLAVRMAVGLDPSAAGQRISLVQHLKTYSEARGLGLQMSDLRLGRVRGEWWTVCSPSAESYQSATRSLTAEIQGRSPVPETFRPRERVSSVLVLSAVGPARVGTTVAIARDLAARNIGVVAASVSALHEIAHINLVVPVSTEVERDLAFEASASLVADGLGDVASIAAVTPWQGRRDRHSDLGKAADYQLIRTGPYLLQQRGRGQVHAHALWLAWELLPPADRRPTTTGAEFRPEMAVSDFLSQQRVVEACEVTYSRVRRLPSGERRGRAKLSLTLLRDADPDGTLDELDDSNVAERLSSVCLSAERHLAQRAPDMPGNPYFRVLRIGWRERWLGGWDESLL